MNRRIAASTAFTLTLAAGALLAPHHADAATIGPVTSGNGWKLLSPAITHIDTQPWIIAFHDTTSRTKLTPYVTKTAAEISSYLGIKITVTTRIIPTTLGKCGPTSHAISYRWISKPNPARPNQSFTQTCGTAGHAAKSAAVYINSDYWAPGRRFHEYQRMNVIWHESAHAVGLAHPTTCPTNAAGLRPLMCADTYKDLRTRRYSPYEATAFRHLVANRIYYPTTAVATR